MIMAAAAEGNSSTMTSVTTLRHNRLVARTLALSRLHTGAGGLRARARCAARRVIRSISGREYVSVFPQTNCALSTTIAHSPQNSEEIGLDCVR